LPHDPLYPPTIHDLTLEERNALERAVDGTITPTMIADVLRGRGRKAAPHAEHAPPYLRALVLWARADLKFYRARIADLDVEIAALMADRDGLYAPTEQDRKTRHIAALMRQKDDLVLHCRPYETILRDALTKLAARLTADAEVDI